MYPGKQVNVNFDKVNEAKMREGPGLRQGWSGGLGSKLGRGLVDKT